MLSYAPFVAQLDRSLVEERVFATVPAKFDEGTRPIPESSADALRRLIPLPVLRANGSFFTSTSMTANLWGGAIETIGPDSVIVDPACGAGDLLIPALERLLTLNTSPIVAGQIRGADIQSSFVAAARKRMQLTLKERGLEAGSVLFDGIQENDFLKRPKDVLAHATHVVLNPPFIPAAAPEGCAWGGVRVNAAALFVDACLREAKPGAILVALLPEVLRSGSRYERWRSHVENFGTDIEVAPMGQFDAKTDIDVFRLRLTVSEENESRLSKSSLAVWQPGLSGSAGLGKTVGDYFDVHVGPVVPHRHNDEGTRVPFLHARGLESWTSVEKVSEERGFGGTMHSGPFVVVRRTSRPGERERVRGTVILDQRAIAVENHLIVLKPRLGGVAACLDLMHRLKSTAASAYLNHRINCRHLTVGAIKDIPWADADLRHAG
jgi:hypothetical protein